MAGEPNSVDMGAKTLATLERAQDAEPELTIKAAQLLTFNGIMNRLASLLDRFECGGDRDEIAAMNGEHKTIKLALETLSTLTGHSIDAENGRRLARIESQLSKRSSGGTTSFDGYEPPEAAD